MTWHGWSPPPRCTGGGVFFCTKQGFPQDLGFWPPRGTSQKKVKFFFFRALLCVVCSINADSTLRYAPLRTTDAPTDYFSEERSGGLFAKN